MVSNIQNTKTRETPGFFIGNPKKPEIRVFRRTGLNNNPRAIWSNKKVDANLNEHKISWRRRRITRMLISLRSLVNLISGEKYYSEFQIYYLAETVVTVLSPLPPLPPFRSDF